MKKKQDPKLNAQAQKIFSLLLPFVFYLLFASNSYAQDKFRFKDADIKIVLQAIAQKAILEVDDEGNVKKRVNIITNPEVGGLVTVNLSDVSWLTALEGILKAHGYGYEWIKKDLILVATLDELATQREKDALAAQQEPLEITAYKLKFLDARDVKKLLDPQLSSRGKITVLEIEAQKMWKSKGGLDEQGGFEKAEREGGARLRTKTLVITETKSNMGNILKAIREIDIMPRQILIETRFMEVSRDKLKDIGLDYGTGSDVLSGASYVNDGKIKGSVLGNVNPSVFSPKSADITGVSPYASGLEFAFKKLTGTQFQVILHALEEDVHTNTLSAPRIVTLDGQEAYIMVGEKRPIIKSEIESSDSSVGISKALDYYQNLGIQLNVVPQVCDNNYINMTIYPSVTSSSSNVDATTSINTATTTDRYPIINVREVQTQILVKDGETITIGGLLKDVKSEGFLKVPILGDIPFLGVLFQRKTTDVEKIDLVVFITVKILNPGEIVSQVVLSEESSASETEKSTVSETKKK